MRDFVVLLVWTFFSVAIGIIFGPAVGAWTFIAVVAVSTVFYISNLIRYRNNLKREERYRQELIDSLK